MKTQRDAIVAALLARGEKQVDDASLSRWWKFTRTSTGRGVPVKTDAMKATAFWFVSRSNGALRVGVNSTSSIRADREVRAQLIIEGRS